MTHLWNWFSRLLLKRIVLVLTLLLCIGVGIALSHMSRLSSNLIESQALQNAVLYTESFNQVINLYSEAAVNRAKVVDGITVTHAYLTQEGGIPLPSTFAIELGSLVSDRNSDVAVRFYSDYPFPWRETEGGPKDDFEQAALDYLRKYPQETYQQVVTLNGRTALRYGEASIMKATCVECHNTHADSPKKDWEVGDVAGVWEISQSLDGLVRETREELRGTFLMLGGLSVLGISGLTLVVGRLRQTAKELEGRVRERTADLADANDELEKRNQLIRQIFGRYLSNDVVANLLESPEGLRLGGDRRKITILTSDLRGFTALSERLPPEEVIHILNLYLEQMAEVINQYKGTIDEFMGDGILVLFGAPTARPDDALRAVACACAMQLAMGVVHEKTYAMGLPPLEMGIGINTGEVVVGNIGSEMRTKYGIVGSQVNLAYRIESYTKGGQILISEATLKEAGSGVKVSGKQMIQPKGFTQPISIFDVYGVSGLYNMYLPKDEEIFLPLAVPIPLQYTLIEDKQVQPFGFPATLIQLSSKGAVMQINTPEHPLPTEMTNLKLNFSQVSPDLQGDVYVKVLRVQGDQGQVWLCFTAVPPAIRNWLETQRY